MLIFRTAMSVSLSTPTTLAGCPGYPTGSVVSLHIDLIGLIDHVIIGDDVSARINDKTGAKRLALAAIRSFAFRPLRAAKTEKVIEEILHAIIAALALALSLALSGCLTPSLARRRTLTALVVPTVRVLSSGSWMLPWNLWPLEFFG